jgi:hypothetical protein
MAEEPKKGMSTGAKYVVLMVVVVAALDDGVVVRYRDALRYATCYSPHQPAM